MTEVIKYEQFWQRRDLEATWASVNPILHSGELGVVTDAGNPEPFKIGDGVTAWNSLPYQQPPVPVLAGGTGNALTATFDPVPVLYDGLMIGVRAASANTTVATLAVNGGTARAITKLGGTALVAGDIAAAGHELLLRYRASVPRWELLNPAASGTAFDLAAAIHAATGKTTPVDNDEFGIWDSVSGLLRKVTWANVKATAKTYFDTVYAAIGAITGSGLTVSATSRVLGRKTAGSGAVEECTLSEVLDFIGSAAQGDILIRGASAWARLPADTSGRILQTNGAGVDPGWVTPASASVGVGALIGYSATFSSTTDTTSAGIPLDNSIPQSGEGKAYTAIDTTHTPSSATSLLEVTLTLPLVSASTTANVSAAILRDAGANAIGGNFVAIEAADRSRPLQVVAQVVAGSTSATTFKCIWGVSTGTGALNRTNATAAFFGGVLKASMIVREIRQ